MHNNGTTPQIILPDRRLLPDLAPPSGIKIGITAEGIVVTPFQGTQEFSLCLDSGGATQLGVNLISAAAILQKAQQEAAKTPASKVILEPNFRETPDAA